MNSIHQGRDRLNPMADRRAETLTGRERVRLALAHEETDRIPDRNGLLRHQSAGTTGAGVVAAA